jgi:hypothetical protein
MLAAIVEGATQADLVLVGAHRKSSCTDFIRASRPCFRVLEGVDGRIRFGHEDWRCF